jgi:hypothetical protein
MLKYVRIPVLALALAVLVSPACKREEATPTGTSTPPAASTPPVSAPAAFRVTSVELGKGVDASKRVSEPTTSFAPSDTIYASVVSEGSAPEVELVTRWTYEDGQVVDESTQVIRASGPAATEFHIAKPDGWPAGRYKVEVNANGSTVATKEFTVQ